MTVVLRTAQKEDAPTICEMMREFAVFEKLEYSFRLTPERLSEVLAGQNAFVEAIIAENDGVAAGYAIFFPFFATFSGEAGFFLEDLFVRESARGLGIGQLMLKEIARIGRKRGFSRIDFHVLDWNTPARSFYEKLGAEYVKGDLHCKFAGEAFRRLAEGEK